jgi:hypothetical protein
MKVAGLFLDLVWTAIERAHCKCKPAAHFISGSDRISWEEPAAGIRLLRSENGQNLAAG